MRKIAVCICSYNRPEGLRALLSSLDRQRLERILQDEISVLVIDNSQDRHGKRRLRDLRQARALCVKCVHEPRKGFSVARNAA